MLSLLIATLSLSSVSLQNAPLMIAEGNMPRVVRPVLAEPRRVTSPRVVKPEPRRAAVRRVVKPEGKGAYVPNPRIKVQSTLNNRR
jgi:hypothetical protein